MNNKGSFTHRDIISLFFLLATIIAIYYPVFYAEYLFTDEATQIWLRKQGVNLASIPQGRYITYRIFKALFSYVHTIREIKYARIISMAAWMICLPVWYYIIRKIVLENKLPFLLVSLSCLYLVCMPSFAIYIGWAACLQMSIAYTAGLVSGYILHTAVKYENGKITLLPFSMIISCIFGIVSLFTYQNGFGCFFIPFFIQFIAFGKMTKKIIIGIGWSFLIYAVYYLLFKYSLHLYGTPASERSSFAASPLNKLYFLFTKPLAASFHFTWLFNDTSMPGKIVYLFIFSIWFALNLTRRKAGQFGEVFFYFAGLALFFTLVYLPSLVVAENYPSNRTLFALNCVVFILVAETILFFAVKYRFQYGASVIIVMALLINAWYNFHDQFVYPLVKEYNIIKKKLLQQYTPGVDTVYFIRPAEDAFTKKYGIVTSRDEFGLPSSSKSWTPEPLIKQLVFEKTGNREIAERLVVKSWENNAAFIKSGASVSKKTILIDAGQLLETP